jgi:hypothetical protein
MLKTAAKVVISPQTDKKWLRKSDFSREIVAQKQEFDYFCKQNSTKGY